MLLQLFSWLKILVPNSSARALLFLFFLLRYLDGRIFIIDVLPQSQAEVDEVVLVGDVIDEINGSSLRNASSGQVRKGAPGSLELGCCFLFKIEKKQERWLCRVAMGTKQNKSYGV